MSILIANTNGQGAPGLAQASAAGAVNLRAAHTLVMRIRFVTAPTNIDVVPIAFTADADLGGSWIERRSGDGATVFSCKRWNAAQTTADTAQAAGYATGVWKHYALTYDATNIRSYLDGALVNTTASATTRTSNTAVCTNFLAFGGQYVLADCGFFGRALTLDEIKYLNAGRLGMVLSKGDCFGWYPLFRDSFRQDFSGRGNDLDDFGGTGTAPAINNEDPGVSWARANPRLILPPSGTAVAADGDGRTVFNGLGTETVAVAAAADGRTVFNGLGNRTAAVAASADGRTLFNGSATASKGLAAAADGRTLFNGLGTPNVAIAALADGRTRYDGLGATQAAVAAAGDGRTLFNGLGSFGGAGDGRTLFNGLGTPSVAIAASGGGLTLFNGFGNPTTGESGGGSNVIARRSYAGRRFMAATARRRVR